VHLFRAHVIAGNNQVRFIMRKSVKFHNTHVNIRSRHTIFNARYTTGERPPSTLIAVPVM
jgi:hypothetical protein